MKTNINITIPSLAAQGGNISTTTFADAVNQSYKTKFTLAPWTI